MMQQCDPILIDFVNISPDLQQCFNLLAALIGWFLVVYRVVFH